MAVRSFIIARTALLLLLAVIALINPIQIARGQDACATYVGACPQGGSGEPAGSYGGYLCYYRLPPPAIITVWAAPVPDSSCASLFDCPTTASGGVYSLCGPLAPTYGTIYASDLCGLYSAVQTSIFVLGLLLMILGGAVYAGSTILPGSSKGTIQGYGMGMLLGGVIGVIMALLAPYILGVIVGNSLLLC